MNSLQKFIHLHHSEKVLLFEAIITSSVVKIVIILFPLRWYVRYLGVQHALVKDDRKEIENTHSIVKITKAIVRCRKVLPWKNACLAEAITAKRMLKRRGISSTLFFGVTKEDNKMTAHAWLKCGSLFVTGGQGIQKFTVVSSFA